MRPGDPYWESVDTFVRDTLIARGLVAAHDTTLYRITDSCDDRSRRHRAVLRQLPLASASSATTSWSG